VFVNRMGSRPAAAQSRFCFSHKIEEPIDHRWIALPNTCQPSKAMTTQRMISPPSGRMGLVPAAGQLDQSPNKSQMTMITQNNVAIFIFPFVMV